MIHSSNDTYEMKEILRKLNDITEVSTKKLVEASKSNDDIRVALETTRSANGIKIQNFEIIPTEHKVGSVNKKYYDIVNETGSIIYKELSLFESAMSIAKRLMLGKNTRECSRIAKMDAQYDENLIEATNYKRRMNKLTESFKMDLYEAKMSQAMRKAKDIRKQILLTL